MSFVVTEKIREKIAYIQRRVLEISDLAAEQDCGVTISSLLSGSVNAVEVNIFCPGKPLVESYDSYTWFYDAEGDRPYEGMCAFLDKWELKIKLPNESVDICESPIDCGKQLWDGRVWECPRCHTEFMVGSRYFGYCPYCGCGLDK